MPLPRTTLSALLAIVVLGLASGCSTGSDGSGVRASGVGEGAASGSSVSQAPGGGAYLDRALPATVESLRLTDQSGRQFTLADLHGSTVVLTDFLTTCQEICPLTTVTMEQAAKALGPKVRFVEVTVDPQRDDPQRMAAYAALFGADQRVRFATAKAADLSLLWKSLGVYYERVAGEKGAVDWQTGKPLTYDVDHQDIVFVLDASGHERWQADGTPNTVGEAPPTKLKDFLSPQGKQNLAHAADPSWTAKDIEEAVAHVGASAD